jgi:hypothetical protein
VSSLRYAPAGRPTQTDTDKEKKKVSPPNRRRIKRGEEGEKMRERKIRNKEMGRKKDIKHFRDLEVYRRAFDAAMEIFQLTMEKSADKFCF